MKVRRAPGFGLAKIEEQVRIAHEQRLNERDQFETENKVK